MPPFQSVLAVIRLLPYSIAPGPANMAADEALLCSAANGAASLRFYGWTSATLSLGYFQPAAIRLANPRLARLPFVRRPSGGATLVHHREITYALALPKGAFWQTGESWLVRMHRIIAAALADLGVRGVSFVGGESARHGEFLCFQQFTPGDVLCGGRKIVGSAQRKHHQALMQHGSVLLAQSNFTPELPGICELADTTIDPQTLCAALAAAFAEATGWEVQPSDWTEAEKKKGAELAVEKYASPAWNEKR